MPNIKSSVKRVSVAANKTKHNSIIKSSLRTSIKRFNEAVTAGDNESIEKAYNNAVKSIDKSVSKGVLHRNTGARKKSQLAKSKNTLQDKK